MMASTADHFFVQRRAGPYDQCQSHAYLCYHGTVSFEPEKATSYFEKDSVVLTGPSQSFTFNDSDHGARLFGLKGSTMRATPYKFMH